MDSQHVQGEMNNPKKNVWCHKIPYGSGGLGQEGDLNSILEQHKVYLYLFIWMSVVPLKWSQSQWY